MTDRAILEPGATIGILGGGQLGRMLATAAAELGFRTHVFCPDPDSPAFDVAAGHTVAAYDDVAALADFASRVAVVTYEFENVPLAALETVSSAVDLRPGARSLQMTQDRLAERQFIESVGARVAPYLPVGTAGDLDGWEFGEARAVLKTRRLGYDGKAQAVVASHDEATTAYERFGAAPSIIERHIPFRCEASAVVARALDGTTEAFEPAENTHPGHILKTSRVPARIALATAADAVATASRIAEALDHVGVLAVEYFVVGDGADEELIVNEIAPRVHNSGHWTQDGATVSQFEQHIRAVAGWPLARARTRAPTVMTNLVGDEVDAWRDLAAEPGARVHLYAKREVRPGRKMGHVNRVE